MSAARPARLPAWDTVLRAAAAPARGDRVGRDTRYHRRMLSSPGRLGPVSAAILALLTGTAVPAAEPARCEGTLSGDVTAKFACSVVLGTQAGGDLAFVISIPGPLEGVPSLVPGAFELPAPAKKGTFTLNELGMGKASVAKEGGALYTATKTSSQRGEVTLTLTSVKRSAKIPGGYDVRGTYRAKLVPVGGGLTGEVVVDVKF